MSRQGEGGASARVADVLKSGLERRLLTPEDAVQLSGHGSHIVTQVDQEGGGERSDDAQMAVSWDEERFQTFVQRLSETQDAGAL